MKNPRIQTIFLEKSQPNNDGLEIDINLFLDNSAVIIKSKYNSLTKKTNVMSKTTYTKAQAREKYKSFIRLGFTLTSNTKVSHIMIDSGPAQAWDGEEYLRTYLGLGADVIREGEAEDFDEDFGTLFSYGSGLTKSIYQVAEKWAAKIENVLGSPVGILNDGITH